MTTKAKAPRAKAKTTKKTKTAARSSTAAKPAAKRAAKAVTVPKNGDAASLGDNFDIGDKVVYPGYGVGTIQSIDLKKVGSFEQKFFKLTIIETGMVIMVPTGQVDTVGLRKVVDSKTVDKVYDILRDRDVQIDTQTWNRRYREYTQKIKTGSVFEIATVIRDLSVLKSDKELSFGERKMLDTAQGLLVKEISIAVSRPEDSVKAELQELFHHSTPQ